MDLVDYQVLLRYVESMIRSTSLSMGWTISGMLARPTAVGNVLAIKLGAFFSNSLVVAVML